MADVLTNLVLKMWLVIKITMDKFDDLPDIVEKDTKPKFVTEVHKPAP